MLRKAVLRNAAADEWLVFTGPLDVVSARNVGEVGSALAQAERRVSEERLFAAGFVCYEAAPAFDAALVTRPAAELPLLCLGLFPAPERRDTPPPWGLETSPAAAKAGLPLPWEWRTDTTHAAYLAAIRRIKSEIEAGNTYQVNFTLRQRTDGMSDPWRLFLEAAVDAPFAAYLEGSGFAIVSASPELFFRLEGDRLECRPMKGTAPRGMTPVEDRRHRAGLHASFKDRAENVMIADMVRNDLGRVAAPGSVRAAALFDIEKYRTVWQLTSTITAATDAPITDIFTALFPSASVTGAPKVASMKLIAELESTPRQIYTGAIGYMAPDRAACFSVAIRTVLIDSATGRATYGTGGGIVWDSVAEDEFEECLSKARVLASPVPDASFRLFESLLWTPEEGYFLLDEHLERLAESAGYFDFTFDRSTALECLAGTARSLPPSKHRVRLLLQRNGGVRAEPTRLHADTEGLIRIALADAPVDKRNPFLYHKTTQREVYDQARAGAADCDDVLLWNTDGEVTETAIGNVVARIGGKLVTPPVDCGLLAGTFRGTLIEDGIIGERTITLAELADADAVFRINSVRGWSRCRLLRNPRMNDGPILPVNR